MDQVATGTFEVTLTPDGTGGDPVDALAIAKTFGGDLAGTGRGRMLAFRSAVPGSAGDVAMERVTARLAGREGAFTLQHSGTMHGGASSLSMTVVPGSATGELSGLSGSMDIAVSPGRHDYRFRYSLPDAADPPATEPT